MCKGCLKHFLKLIWHFEEMMDCLAPANPTNPPFGWDVKHYISTSVLALSFEEARLSTTSLTPGTGEIGSRLFFFFFWPYTDYLAAQLIEPFVASVCTFTEVNTQTYQGSNSLASLSALVVWPSDAVRDTKERGVTKNQLNFPGNQHQTHHL